MHTKIIERHPLALGRGILHRASSVAALALTPKTDRFFRKKIKKNVAKQGTLFCAKQHAKNWHAFLVRPWRHCVIPTQIQKTNQKNVVKINIIFRAKKSHAKLNKKYKI